MMKSLAKISRYSFTVSTSMSSSSISLMSFLSVLFETTVLSFLASDLRSNHIFPRFLCLPSIRCTSSSTTALRYSSGSSAAISSGTLILAGQPPRIINRISFISSTSPVKTGENSFLHSFSSETSPEESPDSNSDMGRICIFDIRPAPLWRIPLWSGVAEPVRMYWPFPFVRSTS